MDRVLGLRVARYSAALRSKKGEPARLVVYSIHEQVPRAHDERSSNGREHQLGHGVLGLLGLCAVEGAVGTLEACSRQSFGVQRVF